MPSISVKDASSTTQTVQTLPAVGAALSNASLPVVLATDQAAITVNLGTLGSAATAALQTTGNTSLASILTALGSTSTSALQTTGNTSLASILAALGTTSTAALQTTGNTSLASILTALGATSTSALQATGNTSLASIVSALAATSTSALQTTGNTSLATIVTALAGSLNTVAAPSENHLGEIGGNSVVATATFTRPANTTAYTIGQLVANSTVAGSVVPMTVSVARKNGGTGRITRARLSKSSAVLTNASFRVHLYRALPTTISNGDGGAWLTNESTYIGAFDITMDKVFTDAAKGIGTPSTGAYVTFDAIAGTTTVFALVEARAGYTPTSAEVFNLALETDRD